MIYHAMIGPIPYLQVSARNDDEARRRVIERCRKDCIGGLCKRWKDGGAVVSIKPITREEARNVRTEDRIKALRVQVQRV
jgi:hypothetical protein